MARACSSNSLWIWLHMVTMPVSCGRGLTSENHTWSPLTNNSTPKMPRPPRLSVTALAISRERCKRRGAHRLRLPAFDVIALHLHMADGLAEKGFHFARSAHRAHGEQRDFVIEIDEAFDDHPPLIHPAAAGGVIPGRLYIGRAIQPWIGPCRRRTSPA